MFWQTKDLATQMTAYALAKAKVLTIHNFNLDFKLFVLQILYFTNVILSPASSSAASTLDLDAIVSFHRQRKSVSRLFDFFFTFYANGSEVLFSTLKFGEKTYDIVSFHLYSYQKT